MEISHGAMLDDGPETSIEKNATTPAAVKSDVLGFIAIDNQIFETSAFDITAAHDCKHCGRLSMVSDHAIGIQGSIDGKPVPGSAGDAGHSGVKSTGVFIPDGDTVPHIETGGALKSDL